MINSDNNNEDIKDCNIINGLTPKQRYYLLTKNIKYKKIIKFINGNNSRELTELPN